MNLDEQGFPIITPYSQNSRDPNGMDIHQQEQILHHTPRQYSSLQKFHDIYGNESPSMLQNTPRYPEASGTIKEEQDLNNYLYFRGDLNVHQHADHNAIRYPSHNPYPSDLNSPNAGSLAMPIAMTSRLESPVARLVPGPAETSTTDFRYQMRALQSQHQRHQHGSLPHHQRQNHSFNHIQGNPAFFSPSMDYSSLDPEHSSHGRGALDRHPQTQLNSLEYDSTERHVPVSALVYDSSLPHEPMTVPGHSQQGTLNHRGSLANSNNPGSGSYHTSNSPASIPMSNNEHNHGATSSMNTSLPGAHPSSSFRMGPSNSSRWVGHPPSFDIMGSTAGATSAHGQVPALSSTPASPSSLRPILRPSDSDSRSSPEDSFTRDSSRLRPSTSAQTLSSSQSTHSYTNSPSPRLSDNDSVIGKRDDRESDRDVDTNETFVRTLEKSPAGKKKAGEEVGESFLAPLKKKKKSKMHRCEVCGKKFPRPSGLRTHMNTHNNEKPYPCGFPGCTRTFGVRSNAKRHLRTHGVIPTTTSNLSSIDAPYVVGFCPPMILVPQSSSHQQSQLHSVEGAPGNSLQANKSDVQHEMNTPPIKLRWMPPSLTTRTNAESLREVRDKQQAQEMGEGAEEGNGEEEEDEFVSRSGVNKRTGRVGYDVDDVEDGVGDGDEGLNIPLPPASTSTVAGIQLTVSHPTRCICSPPCSRSSTQRCRSSPFTSMSPVSSTSFVRSNNSMSPPSMSAYGQHEIGTTDVGGGVYTRNRTISQEYPRTEERNTYLEVGSHSYHPSQNPKYFP